jgi:hypothetical protein
LNGGQAKYARFPPPRRTRIRSIPPRAVTQSAGIPLGQTEFIYTDGKPVILPNFAGADVGSVAGLPLASLSVRLREYVQSLMTYPVEVTEGEIWVNLE